jgi:hypothetical protein
MEGGYGKRGEVWWGSLLENNHSEKQEGERIALWWIFQVDGFYVSEVGVTGSGSCIKGSGKTGVKRW